MFSPKKMNANIATNPGAKTKRGKASLISKFFIPSITNKNAIAPNVDFKNKTNIPEVVSVVYSTKKKKGIAKIKLNNATSNENPSADSLKRIFFWEIAAPAEKTAEIKDKTYHSTILLF